MQLMLLKYFSGVPHFSCHQEQTYNSHANLWLPSKINQIILQSILNGKIAQNFKQVKALIFLVFNCFGHFWVLSDTPWINDQQIFFLDAKQEHDFTLGKRQNLQNLQFLWSKHVQFKNIFKSKVLLVARQSKIYIPYSSII